ncbi:MAG TPA: exonuclease SbcCD subunit D [Abditibacteriaceae bacterium]|jgi:exonuclease SbcD
MKILHFADVHLGMENYGRVNPQTGLHSRFEDGLKCLTFIVDTAIERNVDAAIFAGDAYRTSDPNPTHQHGFASQMRRLRDAGIPLIMVPGNHDMPVSFGRKSSLDIFSALGTDCVHVLATRAISVIETHSGPLQIVAFPWPSRATMLAKDEFRGATEEAVTHAIESASESWLRVIAQECDRTLPTVLVAHVMADRAETSGSEYYAAIMRDPKLGVGSLALEEFDYVALGHVHKFQDLNKGAQPPVVYTGSMDRINFGEEKDTKGFCVVEIEKGNATYEFVETPVRVFVTIRADIDADEEPTAAILAAIDRRKEKIPGAVVRVVYDAESGRDLDLDFKELHAALAEAWLVDSIARAPRVSEERVRRSDLTESLGWPEALDKYAEVNRDIVPYLPEIKAAAARIEATLKN